MDIAICVIAYNRIDSLQRGLYALEQSVYNASVKLYISVDKSDTDLVERFATDYKWPFGEKEVILHDSNLGLRKHVLSCGDLLEKHDALIVLEDDIWVSKGFFMYVQQTVDRYEAEDDIAGISLYNFPISYHSSQPFIPLAVDSDVYLMQNDQSWGQVWMRKQWFEFKRWYSDNCEEFTEKPHLPKSICSWPRSSWLKYHTRYCIENNKYFVYPYKSFSTCFSDTGVHTLESSPRFQAQLYGSTVGKLNFNPMVVYDSFFENIKIYEWLNLSSKELCIDYYGDKGNREHMRYWLSREQVPYKIVQSYGLVMKPYELNVKYNIEGNDLFLYDTTISTVNDIEESVVDRQFYYMYGTKRITTEKIFDEYFGKWKKMILIEIKILGFIRKLMSYVS